MDYVLSMPARTFFAMHKEGQRLHAIRLAELCDIAAIPNLGTKYHQHLKGFYLGVAREGISIPEPTKPAVCLDAGGPEARDFMFGLFARAKGLVN